MKKASFEKSPASPENDNKCCESFATPSIEGIGRTKQKPKSITIPPQEKEHLWMKVRSLMEKSCPSHIQTVKSPSFFFKCSLTPEVEPLQTLADSVDGNNQIPDLTTIIQEDLDPPKKNEKIVTTDNELESPLTPRHLGCKRKSVPRIYSQSAEHLELMENAESRILDDKTVSGKMNEKKQIPHNAHSFERKLSIDTAEKICHWLGFQNDAMQTFTFLHGLAGFFDDSIIAFRQELIESGALDEEADTERMEFEGFKLKKTEKRMIKQVLEDELAKNPPDSKYFHKISQGIGDEIMKRLKSRFDAETVLIHLYAVKYFLKEKLAIMREANGFGTPTRHYHKRNPTQ